MSKTNNNSSGVNLAPSSRAKVVPLVAVSGSMPTNNVDDNGHHDHRNHRESKVLTKKSKLKRSSTTDWTGEQRRRIAKIEEDIALKIFSDRTITQAFRSADDDRSGEIDRDEFWSLLEQNKIVCGEDDFALLWSRYDDDASGTITIDEFTLQYSFPASQFKEFLDNKEEEQDKCRSLPLTMFFFAVFVILVAFHENTTVVFELESSLKSALTEASIPSADDITFGEINSVDDVYDWAADVLLPTLFQQMNAVSGDPLDPDDWGSVLT